jgi:high-affinity iron transporter
VNLTRFFTVSGVLLVFVAAGILKYGVHDFQEAGVLPGLDAIAFDISGVLDPASWYGAAIAGMFNITATPSVLEMVAWVAYAVPVLFLFLRKPSPAGKPIAPAGEAAPGTDAAPAGEPAGSDIDRPASAPQRA